MSGQLVPALETLVALAAAIESFLGKSVSLYALLYAWFDGYVCSCTLALEGL